MNGEYVVINNINDLIEVVRHNDGVLFKNMGKINKKTWKMIKRHANTSAFLAFYVGVIVSAAFTYCTASAYLDAIRKLECKLNAIESEIDFFKCETKADRAKEMLNELKED